MDPLPQSSVTPVSDEGKPREDHLKSSMSETGEKSYGTNSSATTKRKYNKRKSEEIIAEIKRGQTPEVKEEEVKKPEV